MKSAIDGLNTLLREEISAAETYRQALKRLAAGQVRNVLELCQLDHLKRVEKLTERINELGGTPSKDAGPWGIFMKFVHSGAAALGEFPAVAILEEGEDFGLVSYKQSLDKLDDESSRLVEKELLPAQIVTHDVIVELKQGLSVRT